MYMDWLPPCARCFAPAALAPLGFHEDLCETSDLCFGESSGPWPMYWPTTSSFAPPAPPGFQAALEGFSRASRPPSPKPSELARREPAGPASTLRRFGDEDLPDAMLGRLWPRPDHVSRGPLAPGVTKRRTCTQVAMTRCSWSAPDPRNASAAAASSSASTMRGLSANHRSLADRRALAFGETEAESICASSSSKNSPKSSATEGAFARSRSLPSRRSTLRCKRDRSPSRPVSLSPKRCRSSQASMRSVSTSSRLCMSWAALSSTPLCISASSSCSLVILSWSSWRSRWCAALASAPAAPRTFSSRISSSCSCVRSRNSRSSDRTRCTPSSTLQATESK
mmetsp:Transcript_64057/g.181842  ORF Transcript_64057/g.181842 Transcript_64057/m.181842 type:complete len:339 (-) Transcript_64057:1209-2225(-)